MEDLQSILPQHAIGSNVRWWIGQVEKKDTKYSNRFKVRIVGRHLRDGESAVATDDLPWSHTMLPVTTPYSDGGVTGATANLEVGNWVMGFFLDEDAQRPIIIGSIGHVSNSTTEVPPKHNNEPGNKELKVVADRDTNPNTMQPADSSVSPNLAGHPPGIDEKSTSALISRLNSDNSETNPCGIKFCVSVADPNCGGEKDFGGQVETILGEMLKANQDSGGQLGDYLISKATGELYNYVDGARKYINKIFQVVRTFVARIKGEIVKKIKQGIDELVKALLRPDVLGDSLKTVREFVNKLLENLGCSMADIASRLQNWLTNLLFDYLYQVFKQAACQVDELINGILNEITSLLDGVIEKILGPLSSILGAIASPINLVGGAINSIFKLLGISCDGPNQKCVKTTKVCVDCGAEKKKDFLDTLLANLSNGPLEGNYVCSDANSSIEAKQTKLIFVGGSYRYVYEPEDGGVRNEVSNDSLVIYSVPRAYRTREGRLATFTVSRSGSLDKPSSITYKTIDGRARSGSDYFSAQGTLGFSPGQSERQFTIQILNDNQDEPVEDFFIKFKTATGVYSSYFDETSSTSQLTTVYILQDSNSGGGRQGTEPVDVNIPSATPDGTDDEEDDDYQPETKNPGNDDNYNFPNNDLPTDPDDDDTDVINTDPTYSVTADKAIVGEGGTITYTIVTTNVDNGKLLSYTLDGASSEDDITSDDIDGEMSGTFVINNNTSTVQIKIAKDTDNTELNETLRFSIDNENAFADVVIDSSLSDSDDGVTKTYSVVANKSKVAEGDSVVYTIVTTNVDDGTNLAYDLSGTNITSSDFSNSGLDGTFVIENNTATVKIDIAEDATDESAETFKFTIRNTDANVDVIIDPELAPDTKLDEEPEPEPEDEEDVEDPVVEEDAPKVNHIIELTADKSIVKEGEFIKYTIKTKNVAKGTKFRYTLFGPNITKSDILGESLTGQFIMNNNDVDDNSLIEIVTIGIAEDSLVEDDEILTFAINGTGKTVSVLIDVEDAGDTQDPTNPGIDPSVPGDTGGTPKPGNKKGGGVISFPDPNIGTGGGSQTTPGSTGVGGGITQPDPNIGTGGGSQTTPGSTGGIGTGGGSQTTPGSTGGIGTGGGGSQTTPGSTGVGGGIIQPDPNIGTGGGSQTTPGSTGVGGGITQPDSDQTSQVTDPTTSNFNDPSDPNSPRPENPGYEVVVNQPVFKEPIAGTPVVDEEGVIVELPILDGGGPYVEPPKVLISGQGYGASAIALLNDRGQVAELRITNPGRGYVGEVAATFEKSCVIDSYTMIRPGDGYTEQPRVFVNGEEGIAEAVVADGRVISLRVLDRTRVFDTYPIVSIIGGGGFGALFLPSFVCLDIIELERNEYAKIGTGKYIDCP